MHIVIETKKFKVSAGFQGIACEYGWERRSCLKKTRKNMSRSMLDDPTNSHFAK